MAIIARVSSKALADARVRVAISSVGAWRNVLVGRKLVGEKLVDEEARRRAARRRRRTPPVRGQVEVELVCHVEEGISGL